MITHKIEEIFYGCKKILRILKVFYEEEKPLTLYKIEKIGMIYDAERAIKRLLNAGIIIKIGENPNLYVLNKKNKFVRKLKIFLEEIDYIS